MSKVRAERHLSLQPHLEMHKKAFLERVMLVAAYLPIFGLAAIFRIGSLAMIFASVPTAPESVMSFLYFNVAFFVYGSLTPLLLLVLSRSWPPINQLTALQACQGVVGQYSKDFYPFFIPWHGVSGESTNSSGSFSTVSVWPSLNHKTVRSIQKVEAIFFMVCASSYISTSTMICKVIYSVTLSLVAWTCSTKDVIELSLGISLPLSALLLTTIGDHL